MTRRQTIDRLIYSYHLKTTKIAKKRYLVKMGKILIK